MYPKCSNGFFILIENNKTKVSKPRFANQSAILRVSSHFWVRINILYKIIQISSSLQRNYFRLLYSRLHFLWILHLVGYDFGLALLEDDVCHTYITVRWILVPSTLNSFFFPCILSCRPYCLVYNPASYNPGSSSSHILVRTKRLFILIIFIASWIIDKRKMCSAYMKWNQNRIRKAVERLPLREGIYAVWTRQWASFWQFREK